MLTTLKLALRNLFRYGRRTILTSILICIGVTLVIISVGLTAGFRETAVGILTDTMLSHIQVHNIGYTENVTTSSLDLFLNPTEIGNLKPMLEKNENVKAYSLRIKFMGLLSTYKETTGIQTVAVNPRDEIVVCPALVDRLSMVEDKSNFVKPGEIILPNIFAGALSIEIGDEIVMVCTNRHGSMNGTTLLVTDIVESYSGRMLNNAYIHIDDALFLMRMEEPEIAEVAVRLNSIDKISQTKQELAKALNVYNQKQIANGGEPTYEIHTWNQLSPFASFLTLIEIVIYTLYFVLISIVLISILNIMMMSVYERTKEIGTIASIGTTPRKIRWLFITEGLCLSSLSTAVGIILGMLGLLIFDIIKIKIKTGPFVIALTSNISIFNILLTVLIVLVISVLASMQPAFKAAKMDPVDALGHV